MKTLKILMCLCVLIVCSCETEDVDLQEEELIDVNLTSQRSSNDTWENWDTSDFREFLSLTAQQIAEAISENQQAANDFSSIVQNNTPFGTNAAVVTLNQLLGDDSTALYNIITNYQSLCLQRPSGSYGLPYPPLGDHVASLNEDRFVDFLLNEHCLEFYLPFGFQQGFSVTGKTDVISASHPLVPNSIDIGSVTYYANIFPLRIEAPCDNSINLIQSRIYPNLMILRPNPGISVSTDNYCDYPVYSDIDFTDFFAQ